MADRNNLWETNEPKTRAASTVFKNGDWLMADGAGAFVPLTPGNPVAALCLEPVNASLTPDFASEGLINVDIVDYAVDLFLMPVTNGVADANMEGLTFDVDAADAAGLDVSTFGTQFIISRFIKADLVEVKINPCCDDMIS